MMPYAETDGCCTTLIMPYAETDDFSGFLTLVLAVEPLMRSAVTSLTRSTAIWVLVLGWTRGLDGHCHHGYL